MRRKRVTTLILKGDLEYTHLIEDKEDGKIKKAMQKIVLKVKIGAKEIKLTQVFTQSK